MWPDQRRRECNGRYDGTTSDLVSTGTDTSPLLDTPPPHAWHVSVLNFLVMTGGTQEVLQVCEVSYGLPEGT